MSLDKITGSFCQVADIGKYVSEKSKKPYRGQVKWIKMEPNVQFVVSSKGTASLSDQTYVWILLMFLAGGCRPSGHSCKHTNKHILFIYITFHHLAVSTIHLNNKQKAVRETNSETLLLITTNGEG